MRRSRTCPADWQPAALLWAVSYIAKYSALKYCAANIRLYMQAATGAGILRPSQMRHQAGAGNMAYRHNPETLLHPLLG